MSKQTPQDPETRVVPAGAFVMGSERGRRNERPAHRVWVDEFRLAVRPVTNAQYGRFLSATGQREPPTWGQERFSLPDQPAVSITWFDAVAYCEWLSGITGRPYRLPTEAEREKAARGGLEGALFPWGDDPAAWTNPEGLGATHDRPDRVGLDPANGYGLHNMGDLVHEWCSDWYDAGYYAASPERNPTGPATGVRKVSRGGAWRHQVRVARCAARSAIRPNRPFSDYGFRVCC